MDTVLDLLPDGDGLAFLTQQTRPCRYCGIQWTYDHDLQMRHVARVYGCGCVPDEITDALREAGKRTTEVHTIQVQECDTAPGWTGTPHKCTVTYKDGSTVKCTARIRYTPSQWTAPMVRA